MIRVKCAGYDAWVEPDDVTCIKVYQKTFMDNKYELHITACSGDYYLEFERIEDATALANKISELKLANANNGK